MLHRNKVYTIVYSTVHACLLSSVIVAINLQSHGNLKLEYSSHRIVHDADTGTTVLFLRNDSQVPITVTQVILNDVLLSTRTLCVGRSRTEEATGPMSDGSAVSASELDDPIVWYSVIPNPIPPGSLSIVRVKWAFRPKRAIKIRIVTTFGQELEQILKPENPALDMARICFSEDLSTIFVYLRRCGIWQPERIHLWVNDSQVAARVMYGSPIDIRRNGSSWVVAGETPDCIRAHLDRPLQEGQRVLVRAAVESNGRHVVEESARVLAHFPVAVGSGREMESLVPFTGAKRGFPRLIRILNCPTHGFGSYNHAAMEVMRRTAEIQHEDPLAFSISHVCKYEQEKGGLVFAPLNDIVITNIAQFLPESPLQVRGGYEHSSQRLASLFTAAAAPRPWIALVDLGKDDQRLPANKV